MDMMKKGTQERFFSKQRDMNELAAKWGIGFIGYRRRPDGGALLGKHSQHIVAGKKAYPWKAMVANANAFEDQNDWLEGIRDQLNVESKTSKDFHFESPPFVLTICNAREDESKRKLQDVLSNKSVMEYVVGYYELHNRQVCENVLKDGVDTVVPIELIYTEDKDDRYKGNIDRLCPCNSTSGRETGK
eukprot:scaffold13847_cov73-Cylindrotheca_fusiformis.AAC.1